VYQVLLKKEFEGIFAIIKVPTRRQMMLLSLLRRGGGGGVL